MKIITLNRLNRFWKKGVAPIKQAVAGKFDSGKMLNTLEEIAANTSPDYGAGAMAVKELNGNLDNGREISYSFADGFAASGFALYRIGNFLMASGRIGASKPISGSGTPMIILNNVKFIRSIDVQCAIFFTNKGTDIGVVSMQANDNIISVYSYNGVTSGLVHFSLIAKIKDN